MWQLYIFNCEIKTKFQTIVFCIFWNFLLLFIFGIWTIKICPNKIWCSQIGFVKSNSFLFLFLLPILFLLLLLHQWSYFHLWFWHINFLSIFERPLTCRMDKIIEAITSVTTNCSSGCFFFFFNSLNSLISDCPC